MDQLAFGFIPREEPAPQWIEDLLAEMESQDLINANTPIVLIAVEPAFPDPIAVARQMLDREASRN